MFGLGKAARAKLAKKNGADRQGSIKDCEVWDYAWTKEVKAAFYSHPYHAKFWKRVQKNYGGMAKGMWVLDCEPSELREESPS